MPLRQRSKQHSHTPPYPAKVLWPSEGVRRTRGLSATGTSSSSSSNSRRSECSSRHTAKLDQRAWLAVIGAHDFRVERRLALCLSTARSSSARGVLPPTLSDRTLQGWRPRAFFRAALLHEGPPTLLVLVARQKLCFAAPMVTERAGPEGGVR